MPKLKIIALALLLSGCSLFPTKPTVPYSKTSSVSLDKLSYWSLDGRLAISNTKDSWSANMDWHHNIEKEHIKLSGPLGQGATVIELTKNKVTIDRGDGKIQSSNQPEQFINQQLGMFVPVSSLRYWIIGLPEPNSNFVKTATGFKQAGWLIDYKEMQHVKTNTLPYKMNVSNEQVKLKLIIDEWQL